MSQTRSKRGTPRRTWLLVLVAVLVFLAEQHWQRQAEADALTQAHQRIQLGDSAEQVCQVLQAVRLITVLPDKQARCEQMGLIGLSLSGSRYLSIYTQNGRVTGKATRYVDVDSLPCTAPPDEGQVQPPTRQAPCN